MQALEQVTASPARATVSAVMNNRLANALASGFTPESTNLICRIDASGSTE
jgi:hypothetical protein